MRGENFVLRIVVAAALLVAANCGAAFADAGAPDPSFGTSGVVDVTKRSTKTTTRSTGAVVMLPDGGLVVPSFVEVHRMKKGEQVGVRSRTAYLTWLDANGRLVRRSAPLTLPVDLRNPDLVRAPDGHLMFVGTQNRAKSTADALYLLRMSADGAPEAAPGAASPVTTVAFRSMPQLALSTRGRVLISDAHIASNGRTYVLLSQMRESKNGYQIVGYGPLVLVAIDPAAGVARDYAGGGLVVAPATTSRSSRSASTALDAEGRMLIAVRESKRAIAGTTQDVRLARYDTAGVPDPSFAGGTVDMDGGAVDTAYSGTPSVAVLRNGDVLVRTDAETERGRKLTVGVELARFLPTGQPAPGFGASGRSMIVLISTKSNEYGSASAATGDSASSASAVLEQGDGKLVIAVSRGAGYGFGPGVSPPRRDLARTTPNGILDTTYEKQGFARIDVPWIGYAGAYAVGMDLQDRVVGMVWGYESSGNTPSWVVRLLAGDRPAAPASLRMALDKRASCGASSRRACFDPDGSASITGKLTSDGRPLQGGTVVVTISRPRSDRFGGESVPLPIARTRADGTFRLPINGRAVMPGPWTATARVLATPASQRIDTTRPLHFTLGPRKDIATLRSIQRAQALATLIGYIVDDSMDYDVRGNTKSQCTSIEDCFRPSDELQALVGTSMHPAPGKAGLRLGKPGAYTIVTRVDTPEFNLEFVYTEGEAEWSQTCRGDAAARKRWCPDGSWYDYSSDPFVVAGVNGSPFDY